MHIIDKDSTPCEHLAGLQDYLASSGLEIFGEWTQSPDGWVNIHCRRCNRYYRVDLREGEPEEALAASRS
jgi:hypothetical protein